MLTLAGIKTTRRLQGGNVLLSFPVVTGVQTDKTPDEILEEYRENIASVDAYVTAVEKFSITSISDIQPEWYNDEFKKKFTNCKIHSDVWINDINHLLQEVPCSITHYNTIYGIYAGEIKDACISLNKKYDKDLSDYTISNIEQLKQSVSNRKEVICELERTIDKFIENLKTDKKFFDETYNNAVNSINADKDALDKLEKTKGELEEEIHRIEKIILGTGISGGVLLTVAPIGYFFGPIGIFIGVIMTAGAVANLTTAIVESQICEKKKDELQNCINNMDNMTKTIASLSNFRDGVNDVIKAAEAANAAISEIKSCWNELEQQMQVLIDNLNNIDVNAKRNQYNKIINEIDDADREWCEIVEKAKIYEKINMEIKKDAIIISKTA
jgi:flagellar biosynthesis chaperone FliJ